MRLHGHILGVVDRDDRTEEADRFLALREQAQAVKRILEQSIDVFFIPPIFPLICGNVATLPRDLQEL